MKTDAVHPSTLMGRLISIAALVACCALNPLLAADTEPAEIPDGILAKMARMNAKMGVDKDRRDSGDSGDAGQRAAGRRPGANPACGSLNVGNVDTGGRRLGAPREVTVVIKGDVINANNKCR